MADSAFSFSDVRRFTLEPGETLVLWMPANTSPDVIDLFAPQLADLFPDNPVLILEQGCTIERRKLDA